MCEQGEMGGFRYDRTIVVGDVHGCGAELLALCDEFGYPRRGDRMILVGDLFDRGTLPHLVLNTIRDHVRDGPERGYVLEFVVGNHDVELLEYCRMLYDDRAGTVSLSRIQQDTIRAIDEAGVLEDFVLYLEELSRIDTIRAADGSWAVVHAGIDPRLGIENTPSAIKRTIKAMPDTTAWYDEYDGRDGLIICGHQHQREPMVRRRSDRPIVINVDTGCCYGGRLTAYIIEEDSFASVPARQTYYLHRA